MSIMSIHLGPDPHPSKSGVYPNSLVLRNKFCGYSSHPKKPFPLNSRLQTAAAMDVLPANQTVAKGMRGVAIIFNRAEKRLQQSK